MVRVRRLLGALVALVAALFLALGSAPAANAIGELSETGSASFSDLAACTAQSGTLLTAVVVDESLSLRSTDPDDLRVDAILTALDSLERLDQNTDLSVQASLAVFGERYTELVGWGAIDGGHLETLRDAARDQLPDRDGSNLTDYREALSGAQASLAEQAASTNSGACKLVLWLTDGRLDVDGVGDAPATDAARAELCAPGGIIDGVRADGVAVVAMGLMTAEGRGSVTQLDRDRLQAISEGQGGVEQCGTVPVPESTTNGAFLTADDAGALSRLFAQMGALLEAGSNGQSFLCPGDVCVGGRLEIPVDPGVGGFRTVIEAVAGSPAPQLVAPDGTTVALDAATAEAGGATVSTLAGNGLITVDVRTPGETPGTWTLVTDPSNSTVVDLYYFWGVTLAVDAPEGVVIGETSTVRVVPLTAAGTPLDLSSLQQAELTATIDGVATPFAITDGAWVAEVTVPQTDAVSALTVTGQATALTTPHQIALGPVSVEQTLATAFPPAFPSITPAELDFGRLSESTSAQATLQVVGAERGPTQACFGVGTVTGPEAAGETTLRADGECVHVPAGESVEVTVTLSAAGRADGLVTGQLPVQLIGVDGGDPIEIDVPISAAMVRPIDTATRNWLVVALTLAALALAWATAAIGQRLVGRFAISDFAKIAVVPVRATAAGLQRRDGSTPLLEIEDFRNLRAVKGKSFEAGPATFRVRYPIFPLREAQPLVLGRDGRVPISHVTRSSSSPGERFSDLPGSNGFTVVTDHPRGSERDIEGDLVVILDPPAGSGIAERLSARLVEINRVRWSAEIDRAREAWSTFDANAASRASKPSRGGRTDDGRPGQDDGAPPAARDSDGGRAADLAGPPPPRRGGAPASGGSTTPPPPRNASVQDPRSRTSGPRSPQSSAPRPSTSPSRPARNDDGPPPPRRR